MFLGQFEHAIDEKGRMTIPARFREELGDVAYITRAFDQNLTVMSEPVFEAMAEKLNALSVTSANVRMLQRLIFSNAAKVEFDRSGRILIPQYLRDEIKLQGTAMVVGQGKRFEIWAPELWAEQVSLQNSPATTQCFEELDLPLR